MTEGHRPFSRRPVKEIVQEKNNTNQRNLLTVCRYLLSVEQLNRGFAAQFLCLRSSKLSLREYHVRPRQSRSYLVTTLDNWGRHWQVGQSELQMVPSTSMNVPRQ